MGKTNKKRVVKVTKTLIKKNKGKEQIEELVDDDHMPIGGDTKKVTAMGDESEVAVGWDNPITTDDFIGATAQGPRFYGLYGYPGTYINYESANMNPRKIAENRMKNMLEDILSKNKDRRGSNDISNKLGNDAILVNSIPTIDELGIDYHKPLLAKKVISLKELIDVTELSGKEMSSILNYLLSNINTNQVPPEIKRELRNKI